MLSRAEIITAVTMRLLIFEINERDLYHAVSVAEHCNHCGPLSGFLSVLQHPIGRAPEHLSSPSMLSGVRVARSSV
jgi:hypothetical protein